MNIPKMSILPHCLQNFLTGLDLRSKQFRSKIRLYNLILSFTSVNANIDKDLMKQTAGVYTYRICGTVHHKIGDIVPKKNINPAYSQIYIFDAKEHHDIRMSISPDEIDSGILNLIQNMLHDVNPYVDIYTQAGLILREKPSAQLNIILKNNYDLDKRFNLPTSDEIAILMIENPQNITNQVNKRGRIITFVKMLKFIS